MAYFLALPNGDKYTIVSESFLVRSNAEKYAKRMGWTKYFIATADQKLMIESGQPFSLGITDTVENVTTITESGESPEKPKLFGRGGKRGKAHVSR